VQKVETMTAPGAGFRPGRQWRPAAVLAIAVLAGITFFVAYPVVVLVEQVIADAAAGKSLGITSAIWSVLGNTALIVGCSSVFALALGSALALINERTDGGIRGIGSFMPVAPLLLPSITGILGWVVLFDPRVGIVNVVLRAALGLGDQNGEGPFDIYSLQGMLFAYTIHMLPTVYLVVAAALRNLDPSVEEASRISGAGPFSTWMRVTLPAIRPALFEAWLLTIINGIALFSVPVILGTNARIEVVSVSIWTYLTHYPPNQQAALVLAAGLLMVVWLLRLIQWQFLPSGRQAVIGGRGVRRAPSRLGYFRYLAKALVVAYILVALVLPVLGLLMVSLEPFWTANIPWSRLSLVNFQKVLSQNPATIRALANSLLLSVTGATLFMSVAAFLMLFARQSSEDGSGANRLLRRIGFGKVIDLVTSMPATLPHSLIGVAFILAFSRWPFDLYGTIWILLLAFFVMEMPYAAAAARSAVSFIGRELSESSRVFGASEGGTMWRVMLPLALPGLAAGWVLIFIKILGEVTASAILSGSSNQVVGSVLLDLWQQGSFPMMTAFALIIWLITSALVICVLWLNNRSLARAN
jgi:iron(III) transport system permease protein